MNYSEGEGHVRFHRTDGQVVVLRNVMFDTISNGATNYGIVSGDFASGDPFHVPFVAWWEIFWD